MAEIQNKKTEAKEKTKNAKNTVAKKTNATKKETTKQPVNKKTNDKNSNEQKDKSGKVQKKYIQKEKKTKLKKGKEIINIQKLLKGKKKLPTFRGRFGKKNIRRKSNKKWQKWRKPRSIDMDRGLQHGYRPKIGYRSKAELRDIHPSGYKEVRVENVSDLDTINKKTEAARIGATVGKRKRNEIIKKANKNEIWVLN